MLLFKCGELKNQKFSNGFVIDGLYFELYLIVTSARYCSESRTTLADAPTRVGPRQLGSHRATNRRHSPEDVPAACGASTFSADRAGPPESQWETDG
jgi:hypothetical protein